MKYMFLLAGLVVFSAYSQQCKKYIERDPLDNAGAKNNIYTKKVVFSQPTVVDARAASFRVMDNNRFFFHLTSGTGRDIIFGTEVIVHFDNKEDLTLRVEQKERLREGTESVTHANCRVYKKEDVLMFYQHKVVAIELVGIKTKFDLDAKDQQNLIYSAQCIIDKIGLDNINYKSRRTTKLIPDQSGTAFDVASSSMIITTSAVKCEFAVDSLDEAGNTIKWTAPKDLVSPPFGLKAVIKMQGGKYFLELTYEKDLGCIIKDSYVSFKFKNDAVLTFNHAGEENCDETPTFIIDITNYRQDFWNEDLQLVRLSYSEYYTDLAVSNPTYIGSFLRYCFQ